MKPATSKRSHDGQRGGGDNGEIQLKGGPKKSKDLIIGRIFTDIAHWHDVNSANDGNDTNAVTSGSDT